jgi:hypothetical protein
MVYFIESTPFNLKFLYEVSYNVAEITGLDTSVFGVTELPPPPQAIRRRDKSIGVRICLITVILSPILICVKYYVL